MQYHFKIHKEKDSFWAQCIELPGCFTQADSLKELEKNMEESLNLYAEEPSNSEELIALPDNSIKKTKNIATVSLNPQIAFALLIRYFRIKNRMTQKETAKKMGFDTIYSYQRLETKKCNPSLKIIAKVKKVFPDFSIDYTMH